MVFGVMFGGALGALSRYLVTLALQQLLTRTPYATFPLATLLINVAGSFLLGLIIELGLSGRLPPIWQLSLGTGFVGAFTTFSTFELESNLLIREGIYGQALLYLLGNLMLGYLALMLGRYFGLRLGGGA